MKPATSEVTLPQVVNAVQAAVLRPKDATRYAGISRAHLYVLFSRGELPRIKLGGKAVGVLRSDIDAWLLKQREAATA